MKKWESLRKAVWLGVLTSIVVLICQDAEFSLNARGYIENWAADLKVALDLY